MPANLPPQYYEAEKLYRNAKSLQEKVEALEAMLSIMPKHKGTDKLRAELRRKIAKISEQSRRKPSIAKKGGIGIRKEGAGQIALVGLPNAGKSQLLASITEASPSVADYPFATQTLVPGMTRFENIQMQLIDLPSITDLHSRSWLPGILRNADALMIVVDLGKSPADQVEAIFAELEKMKIKPVGRETDERLEPGIIQKKTLIVGNKNDLKNSDESYCGLSLRYGKFPTVFISAKQGTGLEQMKAALYKLLDIIRVYSKAPGEKPSFDEPVILKKGSTVEAAAEAIHKELRSNLKYAQIWGSGKFSGQRVKRGHVLEDGDVIELHA